MARRFSLFIFISYVFNVICIIGYLQKEVPISSGSVFLYNFVSWYNYRYHYNIKIYIGITLKL